MKGRTLQLRDLINSRNAVANECQVVGEEVVAMKRGFRADERIRGSRRALNQPRSGILIATPFPRPDTWADSVATTVCRP